MEPTVAEERLHYYRQLLYLALAEEAGHEADLAEEAPVDLVVEVPRESEQLHRKFLRHQEDEGVEVVVDHSFLPIVVV